MKAVVLEVRKNEAAVLCKDGQILKIRRKGLAVGDTIELSNTEICPDRKVVFYKKFRKYGTVAAAAALLLGFGGNHIYNTAIACSYVSLDINPSIEYTLNRQDCVLDITAVNEDAQEIVEQLKEQGIKKESLTDAISMTAELLQENRYITDDETNYILINVASDNDKKNKSLKKEAQSVFDKMNTENENNIHLTTTESSVSERKKARDSGVSAGEYKEIRAIGDEDVSEYKDMKVKELLEKSGTLTDDSKEVISESDTQSEQRNTNFGRNTEGTVKDTNKNQSNSSQSEENRSSEIKQDSETRENLTEQFDSDTGHKTTDQNNTENDTTEQGQPEQQNIDSTEGNFGQPSDNSPVENEQNAESRENNNGNKGGENRQELFSGESFADNH